jgi:hypothetical protein
MFVMCPLLAPPHPRLFYFFHTADIYSTNETKKAGVCAIKQSISLDVYGSIESVLRKGMS